LFAAAAAAVLVASPAFAANDKVQISKLSDLTFGPLSDFSADSTRSESVCIFSSTSTNGYNVRATGSGAGNAFKLASATGTLDYEVQWNTLSGQSSGTNLGLNATVGGLTSTAKNAACTSAPTTTASLIVVIRAAAGSAAPAGDYTGTLTLVFGPE
jgi:hypothetical protein